ncbi:hypothetical protein F443_07671 [Phytophthora nicotianae P1569]|uniref:ZSWIM1/3 RNaseH-like domain-containing protein n=1 Tax=Phytophthora nicotianae P1569 TaxID=1317065 RepID=V9F9Z7_PHYNI|nr:hypothetical protein F443_07671 [Phytophthora nicotianae P1569]
MEDERAEWLTDTIESFQFYNPSWETIMIIVFDKSMAEMDYVKKITDVGSMRYDGAGEKLAFEVSPYAYRLVEA